jgi:hypothetical protein
MTNYFTKLALVAVVGIAGAGLVGADEWNKKTVITTDEVLQLPNATLQPGTYVMKLLGSDANRHIVQFFSKDEKHLITTILAIPNERLRPTGKTVFGFWEVPAGKPKALRAWFYPGDNFGQEFAYPKSEASVISAYNKGATVQISEEKPTELEATIPVEKNSTANIAVAEPAPVVVTEPVRAAEPVEVAAAPQQEAPVQIETRQETRSRVDTDDAQRLVAQNTAPPAETLPKTASNLPLIAFLGFVSLVGALALNVAVRS